MNDFKNCALIFLEITEPSKAPDVVYISIGSTNIHKSDEKLKKTAVNIFKASKDYPDNTEFVIKNILKFESQESYIQYLQNQVSDYVDSLKN